MRELERQAADSPFDEPACAGPPRIGIVGRGQVGTALAAALDGAGYEVGGPAGRREVPAGDAIVLCVPDRAIAEAAGTVAGAAPLVGHTSGATPLAALEPAARAGADLFAMHPLQTLAGKGDAQGPEAFRGCGCAVAGSTPAAAGFAAEIARALGMWPFELRDEDRAAYHAAASIASNFLVTLQASAESVAAAAGLRPAEARRLLAPLVRSTVENWAELGPAEALTGPAARGDEETIAAQRAAVARAEPELLALFDALLERTRAVAAGRGTAAATAPPPEPVLQGSRA